MAKILDTKSIYYNDVNLIAQPSAVKSRGDIPKELNRIIVSPMEAVIGETFAKEANKLGLSLCLHRFCDVDKQIEIYNQLENKQNVFVSVGANDLYRVKRLAVENVQNILIDIANGYIPNIKDSIKSIKDNINIKKLMVGNVMTQTGFWNLVDEDVDTFVRVGIAGGCFVPDSLVKTENGYIEIQNIKIGDKVLTHTGEYGTVTNKFEYFKDEELKVINGITCTKNHEFYVIHKKYVDIVNESNYEKYAEWITADNLTDEYFLIEL